MGLPDRGARGRRAGALSLAHRVRPGPRRRSVPASGITTKCHIYVNTKCHAANFAVEKCDQFLIFGGAVSIS
jgi:hypothetical protein